MSMTDTELKTRRERLTPYTAADRRMRKGFVIADNPIAMRHAQRGLGRKSFARKAMK
jgi:hypothetical protein